MHPLLFTLQLGARELPIASYGVALSSALVVGALGTLRSATRGRPGRAPLELGAVISALGVAIGAGFAGALVLHALAQLLRSGSLGSAPGIAVWGGLLGGAAGVLWLAPRLGLAGWALLDAAVPWVALAQAIGRIGCFLGGCCYGQPFAEHGHAVELAARVPVQLIEAALLLGLALFFFGSQRAFSRAPLPARPLAYVAAYAVLRLVLEPLRGDAIRGVFLGGALSSAQIVSLGCLLALALRLGYLRALRLQRALPLLALGCALVAAHPALAERFARLAPSRPAIARFTAGRFTMGSDDAEVAFAVALCARHPQPGVLCDAASFRDEQPARSVQLAAFGIDRTEVTNAAYQRCAEAGVCTPRRVPGADARHGQPDQPVVLVSALEAEVYCAFAGGRLPTEAQWERAARSGTPRRFPWGHQWNDRLANHGPDLEGVAPVDGFRFLAPVSALTDGATTAGLLHMAGNVWELTADRYDPEAYAHGSPVEPTGAASGELRVMRGGSYASPPHTLRAAQRSALPEREARLDVGFRCAYASRP